LLRWKVEWKQDTGKIHVQNKMTLQGATRVKIQDWTSTVCFMRTSTVQFGCLANLPMVLRHYQHKQL